MRKQYRRNPRLIQNSNTDAHAEKPLILQLLVNEVSLIKLFILDSGLIILLLLGLAALIKEVRRPEVILDPIEVPEDIAKQGYAGNIVAEQLADVALNIELETQELSAQNSWHKYAVNMPEVETNAHIPDISVPGSPFTIRSIARFIRQELGLHADHLQGEIVHEENGLSLTLRTLSDARIPAVRISKKGIEQLFQEGGAALLQLTNPSASAMFAYHKLNKSLSDFAVREANYKEAVRLFEYCLKYQPTAPLALYLWGSALNDLKRPEEAIEKYRRALKLDPDYAYAFNGWGHSLQDLKRPEEAIEQYRKATNIDPEAVYAYYNWGNALQDLKRPEEAIEQYRKATNIDPEAVYAYNNWGKALQDLKRPEEAIELFRKVTDIDPEAVYAYNNWGDALQDLKRPQKAIVQYRMATNIDPKYAYAYNNWGNALQDLKRPEEAIKLYRKATDIDPHYVDAYYNWGNALQKLKRYKEAIEQYRMATNIDPKYASAYISWSKALKDLKRYKEAIEQYRKAIDTDPKAVDACNILEPCPPRSQASQGSDQ
jgi:tetratricopeptide (TPR) repeat protein